MFSALKLVFISDFYKCLTKLKPVYSVKLARNFADNMKYNFNPECEEYISKQINMELNASYAYLAMAYHFERPDVALPGFHNMYLFFSKEETEHAKNLIEFQNKRGGKVQYCEIAALEDSDWTPESSVLKAIEMEKNITESFHSLHETSTKHKDCHLCDFIESQYLKEQYDAIRELYYLLTKIKRVKDGLGIYLLDNDLIREFKNKKIQ